MSNYYRKRGHFTECYVPEISSWISSQWLSRVLAKLGMTPQDWYDKYILGISSAEERPKCQIIGCSNYGKEKVFIGPTLGYRQHCSHACQGLDPEFRKTSSDAAKKAWESDSYRIASSESHKNPSEEVRKRQSDAGYKTWSNPDYYYDQSCRIARGSMIHQKHAVASFYLIARGDYVKVGSTTNIDHRLYQLNANPSNSIIIIFDGPTKDVAELEYSIKMKYKRYWEKLPGLCTEDFPIGLLEDILKDARSSKLAER